MVVAVIGVVLEVPHIGKFFQEGLREALTPKIDLEGEWTYEFKNEDRLISQGTCIIEQLGDDVNIYGRRKNQRGQEVDIPWSTQFGVISGTTPPRQYFPKLHFVYEIEVNSQQIEGYCSISLPKKKSISEMDGDVFQLAPNRDFGRMHFEKSSPG